MVRAVALVAQDRMTRPLSTFPRSSPERRRRDEEERRQRVMVITEFDARDPEATLHALAGEILKYRRALQLLAAAIGWASAVRPQNLESSVPSPTQRASCDRRARQPVS